MIIHLNRIIPKNRIKLIPSFLSCKYGDVTLLSYYLIDTILVDNIHCNKGTMNKIYHNVTIFKIRTFWVLLTICQAKCK